jgi:hypothetical protein
MAVNDFAAGIYQDVPELDYHSGAFGPTETAANNWTTGWTNMDPQNTVY